MLHSFKKSCLFVVLSIFIAQNSYTAAGGTKPIKIKLLTENLKAVHNHKHIILEYYIVNIPDSELTGVDIRTARDLQLVSELLLVPTSHAHIAHPILTPNVQDWTTNAGTVYINTATGKAAYLPKEVYSKAIRVAKDGGLLVQPKAGYTPYIILHVKGEGWHRGPWSIFPILGENILNIELQGSDLDKIRGGWSAD